VAVVTNRKRYAPGEKASLSLMTTNEAERLAPAIAQLAVVDQSVVTMADERTARSLPTHFLLTTEVRKPEDLEHADFLLGSHPKAPVALDLLLGTQGWRRFAEQDPGLFRQKQQPEADRLLVLNGQLTPEMAPKVTNLDEV